MEIGNNASPKTSGYSGDNTFNPNDANKKFQFYFCG